jgi:RNA polymerase sigma factor (sigma-70 family)
MSGEPAVFIVDDDDSVRRALQRLCRSIGLTVELFGSARQFLDRYDLSRPGCLVLDVRMPGLSGLDLQDELNARGIAIPVVFITGHGDIPMSVRAMKAGAVDFISKPFNDQVLLDAIQHALAKDRKMRQEAAERGEILRRIERLTPREREVFALVVSGKLNKQIAHQLGTSEKTVKVHRARVMDKMQAESLADLVLLAQAVGLCKPKVQSR